MHESSIEDGLLKALLAWPAEVVEILGIKGSEHPAEKRGRTRPLCPHTIFQYPKQKQTSGVCVSA